MRDTGAGIEPELLPRIFDAFEQGGAGITRRFGGLGLGLAISRTIALAMGGTLTAASDAGRRRAAQGDEPTGVRPMTRPLSMPAGRSRRRCISS